EYPGRKFTVQCADIANAVAMLSRSDGRMLNTLSWRGTEVARVMAHWRPDQFVEVSAREIARGNPWLGLPGCIFMGHAAAAGEAPVPAYFLAGTGRAEGRLCTREELFALADHQGVAPPLGIAGEATPDLAVDDARWKVPPSLGAMLQSLATLRRPSGSLYRLYTDVSEALDGTPTGYRFGPNRVDVHGSPVDGGFGDDRTIVRLVHGRVAAVA